MTTITSNAYASAATAIPAKPVRQQTSRDDIMMRVVLVLLTLWLLGTVLLPLGALLIKSVEGPKGEFVGLANFIQYFANPALTRSIGNSIFIESNSV